MLIGIIRMYLLKEENMNFAKILTIVLFSTSLMASSLSQAKSKLIPITNAFIPFGFDSNDNSEIVVTGYLPDLCYQGPKYKAKLENGIVTIHVSAHQVTGDVVCPRVIVPFQMTIPMGQLDARDFKIQVNPKTKTEKRGILEVSQAQDKRIDNYMYAYVNDVKVEGDYLYIKGINPSDCFELTEIKIIDNGRDTYSVLPKVRIIKDVCKPVSTDFTYKKRFKNTLNVDEALFHVRVMDGRSVNKVITLKDVASY